MPLNAPPVLVLQLGYASLLPFVAGAALTWIVRPDVHPYALAALSCFLGAAAS
jgi:hypothetical protein